MILALPFIPYLAALLILFMPAAHGKWLRPLAIGATGLCLLIVLFLTQNFDRAFQGFQFVHSWDCFAEMGIRYQVGLDGINLIFCLLLAFVAFAGAFIAGKTKDRLKEYLFYYLLLTGSMFAVFTVLNVFFLYVFYEMTLIPVFAMIGLHRFASEPSAQPGGLPSKQEAGAMKLALYMTAGAMLGLFAIFTLYNMLGPDFLDLTKSKALAASHAALLTPETQKWLAALLIVGFGIMTSLWPFHSWSPSAYSAAPASLSMVHAGVKIGPYFLIRIALVYLPLGFQFWAPTLAILATIGLIYAGFAAIRQKNLNTMAAFSSISHMGYVFLAFAAMNPTALSAGILLIFAHGIMTACLFGLIGHLTAQTGTDGIHDFGGLGKTLPFFSVCFMLTCMASAGIPGFANFPAELLVFISAWKTFPAAVIFGVLGVLITAIYMIRAVQALCFGVATRLSSAPSAQPGKELRDMIGLWDKAPFLVLLAILFFFGFFPSALLSIIQPAVARLFI